MQNKVSKRIISIVALLTLVFSLILVPSYANAASIKISDKTLSLTAGDKQQIKLLNTKTRPTWTSADENIATVNKWGTITAKSNGKVKITAKIKTMKWTCTVDVLDKIDLKVKILNTESDDYQYGDILVEFDNNAEKDLFLYERGSINFINPTTEIKNYYEGEMEYGNDGYLIQKNAKTTITYKQAHSNLQFINNDTSSFKFSIVYDGTKYIGEADSEGNVTFIKWTSKYLF